MNILITAGPTREPLDPVRYLSNRSSGKMGLALAQAALDRGHAVTLILGPVNLPPPAGAHCIPITTAQEMHDAVAANIGSHQAAIFSAAVADYRPIAAAQQKIKKTGDRLTLELEKTPDILGSARTALRFTGTLVGFAAETENVLAHAQAKLQRKQCDLLVANDVSQPGIGFDSDVNEVILCTPHQPPEPLPRASKTELARHILDRIEQLEAQKNSPPPP